MRDELSRQVYAHLAAKIANRSSCEKAHLATMLLMRMLVSAETRKARGHLSVKVTYSGRLNKVFVSADEEQQQLTSLD